MEKFINDAFTRMDAYQLVLSVVFFSALIAILLLLPLMGIAKLMKRTRSRRMAKMQPGNLFQEKPADNDLKDLKDGVRSLGAFAILVIIALIYTCGK